jgi:hypothetical protein
MRYRPTGLNRGWLLVLGLLLLLAGVVGIVITTRALQRVGVGLNLPDRGDPILGRSVATAFATTSVAAGVIVGGLLLALAGLVWLVRQIPRRRLAKPFRLYDDVHAGITRVDVSVLSEAVERQVISLAGVQQAAAQLRGNARRPELTLRVTADERADIRGILDRIQNSVVPDLRTALDTAVSRLAVQLEVDRRGHASTSHITLRP